MVQGQPGSRNLGWSSADILLLEARIVTHLFNRIGFNDMVLVTVRLYVSEPDE
jgi:hypothetical protein